VGLVVGLRTSQNSLRDETQRFKVIFDSIEEGVILIDNQLIIPPY